MFLIFRNPYDFKCLAPYGGPIEPGIAFGGYPKAESGKKPNYRLSNALVLTFLVMNHNEQDKLVPAMEWELE